jgi:excinuclease UvrABC ATPase subunit
MTSTVRFPSPSSKLVSIESANLVSIPDFTTKRSTTIGGEDLKFSENHACPICGFSIGELEPRMFSFNSPFGACPTCDGLGQRLTVLGSNSPIENPQIGQA